MKKTRAWKAAGATTLAAALLIGGGVTLAKWYEEQNLAASKITTGELSMTPVGTPTWTDGAGATIDPATFKMVPGDTVTYKAKTTVTAVGNNLKARLVADIKTLTADDPELQKALQANSTTTVTGLADTDPADGWSVTPADSGKEVEVTVSIKWPRFKEGDTGTTNWGTDSPVTATGAGELANINLDAFKLVLEQVF